MKSMKIQKQFTIEDGITQLIQLQVQEELSYKRTEEGIRAKGPLHLHGLYKNNAGVVRRLQEELEMDVLAPKQKLGEGSFSLELADYRGDVSAEGLLLTITLLAKGLKEEAQEEPSAPAQSEAAPDEASAEEKEETPQEDIAEFEDLFEDADTTYTSCRMIVARSGDTYESIAARYEVNEAQLRSCNHEKHIEEKTLVLLPQSAFTA